MVDRVAEQALVDRRAGDDTAMGELSAMPAIYRTPVLLRDVRGLTTDEASSMLGVKPQTLKSRLHRGRRVLRARLAEFAAGLTLHRAA